MKILKNISLILAFVLLSTIIVQAQVTEVICSGGKKTLTSSVTGQVYQWYKDGSLISGEKGKSLDASVEGKYQVVAVNEHGCASDASDAVNIYVVPVLSPTISITNNSSCVTEGNEVTLTASEVPSTGPNGLTYTYKWRKAGSATILNTSREWKLKDVSESGNYTVEFVPVWNGVELACSAISTEAIVTIKPFAAKPTIQMTVGNYLSDDEKRTGIICERNDVTLAVSLAAPEGNSTIDVSYEWYKDGSIIAGETNSELKLANIQTTSSGSYTVVVKTNAGGCTATSDAQRIDVQLRPSKPSIQFN